MASTRLSFSTRSSIRIAALNHGFKDAEQRVRNEEGKLFEAVRASVLGKRACEQIDAMPEGWLPLVNGLCVEAEDGNRYLNLTASHPLPLPANVKTYIKAESLPVRLRNRVWAHFRNRADLKKDREYLDKDLRIALNSFSTLESLLKRWPEMAPFTRGISPAAENLPALPREQINKALGIGA